MYTNINQGKDHKVVATQESTAQNSANQSKAFGLFTDQELTNIVNNSGSELVKPGFVINYLHQAEKILDRARMSDENKDFIKGAFTMLSAFGNWDIKEHYEYIAQSDYPEDIRKMLEEGDEDEAVDALEYEIGAITGDLQNEDLYFPEEEIDKAVNALQEYSDLVDEYELDLPEWTYREMQKVLNQYQR